MSHSNVIYQDTVVKALTSNASDIQVQGWCLSRPSLDPKDIDFMEVAKLDVPVNELPSITLSITAPIIIRELVTSVRDHSLWSKTSRVENLSENIYVGTYFINDSYYAGILSDIQKDKAAGITQDEFRLRLPITTMSGFTATLSFRTWVKLIKFARKMADDSKLYGTRLLLNDFADKVRNELMVIYNLDTSKIEEIITSYSYANFLSPCTTGEGIEHAGDFTVVTAKVKFSLYAQMVRHRTISFLSNMYEIITSEEVEKFTQDSEVLMSICAPNAIWETLVKKRMCWVAHASLWQPITSKFGLMFTEKDLPCKDGACPFTVDVENRFTDKDPGAPCPKFINLTQHPYNAEQQAKIEYELQHRPEFWDKVYQDSKQYLEL